MDFLIGQSGVNFGTVFHVFLTFITMLIVTYYGFSMQRNAQIRNKQVKKDVCAPAMERVDKHINKFCWFHIWKTLFCFASVL